jgi:formylglycine-generating enzyme required for sulfatase activity
MKKIFFFASLCTLSLLAKANNVQITNVSTTVTGGVTVLNFNIQWDNSWRGGPGGNWDAVWVFVKYKDERFFYTHLDLTGTDVTVPSNLTYTIPADHKGIFIYRSADGGGNIASTPISVGITQKPGSYDVKVFGIEMVNIPQGSFYLGHAGGNPNNFGEAGTSGATPYQITSENAINIGTAAGNLYDSRVTSAVTIPSTWPKGYNSFYIMKYELSQAGYRDFLNAAPVYANYLLPERSDLTGANYATIGSKLFPTGFRNNLYVSANYGTDVVGTNANGNTTYNEANDGEWTACNFLYWSDAAAFLDWAALRPMTEFEYEKAANGPAAINYPQFASGTYFQVAAAIGGALNPYTNAETINHSNLANNYLNTSETGINGPLRGGFAADNLSTRQSSAGSYYGVMELSGNLWEPVVTCANVAGRSFNGTSLGDGSISGLSGRANEDTWPGVQNDATQVNAAGEIQKLYTAGIAKKGGGFDQSLYSSLSDVNYDPGVTATAYPTTRANAAAFGCRGVR